MARSSSVSSRRRTTTSKPRTPITRQNSTLSSKPTQRTLRARISKPSYTEQYSQCSQETRDLLQEDELYSSSDDEFDIAPKSTKRKHSDFSPNAESNPNESKRSRQADSEPTEALATHSEITAPVASTGRPAILEVPAEILQDICFLLPFASDAVPLLLTCRIMYNKLSNNFFWFKRRRQFIQYYHDNFYGAVKRDMEEAYDDKTDYRSLVIKAYSGNTGFLAREAAAKRAIAKAEAESASASVSASDTSSASGSSTSPEPTVKQKKRRAKKGEAKAKADTIVRCQICCMQRAFKHWDTFNKALCPSCYELHAIDRSQVAFLKKLRESEMRCQYRLTGRTRRNTYWRPDVEKEVALQYPGRTLDGMVEEHKEKKAAKERENAEFRQRHRERLIETFMTTWEDSKYDKFREIITEENMKNFAQEVSNSSLTRKGFRVKKTDYEQAWLDQQVTPFFRIFDDDCEHIDQIDDYAIRSRLFTIKQTIQSFHQGRFIAADMGVEYRAGHESSDGRFAVGVCKVCYDDLRFKRLSSDGDSMRQSHADLSYQSACSLSYHYASRHTKIALSRENHENGEWFGFLTGVPGMEPVRVADRVEVPQIPALPPWPETFVYVGSEEDTSGAVIGETSDGQSIPSVLPSDYLAELAV
ncbi:hypothetical protein BJ508DRAFT_321543 [Ascobolus immersus RN42]|uniref:F-box domain-containing protein n=1 Tax=Ascobolus immersus RN42 TaxID=1160509 RepID=A0A3N4IJS1_ASCIM|nr:hypothetical protein BJ508DRAFT_321543 [Ascobolus immersus RN42]